jgi:hypothetical protein
MRVMAPSKCIHTLRGWREHAKPAMNCRQRGERIRRVILGGRNTEYGQKSAAQARLR